MMNWSNNSNNLEQEESVVYDRRHQYSATALSDGDYIKAIQLRDKLNKQIAEYENESRRGSVKVIRTKRGADSGIRGYSVRFDTHLGKKNPYWKTIDTFYKADNVLEFLQVMAQDFSAVYEAFKAKVESNEEDEDQEESALAQTVQ